MAFFRGEFYSNELRMNTCVAVIIPDGVKNDEANVVYLFHGLSDNYSGWTRLTAIERYANQYGVVVVMPEVQRSYYIDMVYGLKYFQYVSKELVCFMGTMFNMPTTREHSFVAGLSMGGYGAMKCALTRPEQFCACAAFSSVCDIADTLAHDWPATDAAELVAVLGEELLVKPENDLYKLAQKCMTAKQTPRILQICGTEDILYPQNISLKKQFEECKFDYQFKEWEGNHTWDFWDKAIQVAFEFFFGEKTGGTKTPLCEDSEVEKSSN